MSFNIFAGARRIAIAIGVLASISIIGIMSFERATVVAIIEFDPDKFVFPKWDDNYPPSSKSDNYYRHSEFTTIKGTDVILFGRKKPWEKYGNSLSKEIFGKEFIENLSPYHHYLDNQYKWAKFRQIKKAISYAFYFNLALVILTYGIGWIIRGFFGIPMGQDFKPKPIEPKKTD